MSAQTAQFLVDRGLDVDETELSTLVHSAVGALYRTLHVHPSPRSELSEGEVDALESVGFDLQPRRLTDDDPLARTAADFAALVHASLTTRQAATRIGCTDARIRQMLGAGQLFGFEFENRWRLPSFQFDHDAILPGLGKILEHLSTSLHPLTVHRWFTINHPDLEPPVDLAGLDRPLSPRDWLRLGLPVEAVAALARGFPLG